MLSKELEKQLDLPFYFFGYSLGALIAFEVARHFQQHGKKAPEHLFVCAKSAPHLPLRHPPIYQLPDQQLIQELKRFDGTPSDVLENQQLMELFLPCLRADFSLNETYKYMDEAPLSCPITAFGGESDEEATTEMLQAWKIHTGSSFQVKTFTGGHFFVTDHLEKIIAEIDRLSSVRK
jgi:medium-chain acyl-[acyl-carrier-protein] hydrolase